MADGILSSSVETIETNTVKLKFTASPEKFEEGVRFSYNKNKSSIQIQGFRKGKVPRAMVERLYGKTFFYSDAVDYVFDDLFVKVLREHKINPVQNPKVEVKEISAETGVAFELEIIVEPLVEISDYLGITYEPFDTNVTEDEIMQAVSRDREKNARVITVDDRPAENTDIVIIDFKGFIDGEPFEGGESKDYELVLGSGSFIEGFEGQLIGLSTGDEATVNVNFPDEYPMMPSLASKAASFEVKLNEIRVKEFPELDDDFAQDVSDFETYDEYKSDIEKKISESKTKYAENHKQDQIIKKLIANISGEIPQVMFDSMSERMYEEYKSNIMNRGLDYEMYLKYSGDSDERIRNTARDDADMRVRSRLALTAVAVKENIEVTGEEIDEEIKKIFETYGEGAQKPDRDINEEQRERLAEDIKVQKALKMVIDAAVSVEPSAKTDDIIENDETIAEGE